MKVTAKFYVESVVQHGYRNGPYGANPAAGGLAHAIVTMKPVYEDKGPNKSWSEATPSGELKMTITNKAAIDAFEPGKAYLMTFEKTDD